MNIGFDVDGVLIDTEEWFRAYAEIYDIEKYGKDTTQDPNNYYLQYRFLWDEKTIQDFVDTAFLECSKKSSIMPGADVVVKKLKELGHNLIIISARGMECDEMITVVEKKFKEHGLKFDKIYWKVEEKLETCLKEKIDIMIDDRPETCLTLSQNNIHAFYFKEKSRPTLKENKNLTAVTNWGEIYKKIILIDK